MNIKKRLASVILMLALVVCIMPAEYVSAATDLNDPSIYYTPSSDYQSGDCILSATKMMIRRASIMRNTGDWTKITNEALRSPATIFGLLLNSFNFDAEGLVYHVESGNFAGADDAARIQELQYLLSIHPEGVVVYGDNSASSYNRVYNHGVLVTGVMNGVVYAADATNNTGQKNAGIQQWSETTMLNPSRVTKYWYIKEITVSSKTQPSTGTVTQSTSSTLRIKSYKAPSKITKGKSFTIKGKVKSNKVISNVTVEILDAAGNVLQSASASPNAKSYNIKSLDSRIKFSRLKKGNYIFRVTATDSMQTKILVDKFFKVKAKKKKK